MKQGTVEIMLTGNTTLTVNQFISLNIGLVLSNTHFVSFTSDEGDL